MVRDRDSAGRLLRVLGDCELFHMEAAIDNLSRVKTGIRSESLVKPSVDDMDVLERTAKGRVLSLSDHKRIARLQAALTTIANAYDVQDGAQTAEEVDFSRNLICTVAGTAMMQSIRDCTASRTNCCIWNPKAEKLHLLLHWMVNLESDNVVFSRDYFLQLMLEWIQPTAEKQNQLAACLTLFELLQRLRHKLTLTSDNEKSYILGTRVEVYMDALCGVVERGVIRAADSHRVKPSKLALIAIETLALLCRDIAAGYMVISEAAKKSLVGGGVIRKMVESMQFVLVSLRQWHLHSARRQFLGYALQHLQSYVVVCDNLLRNESGTGGDRIRGLGVNIPAVLDILCWHWVATAPTLCTRSGTSSRIQKNRPSEILTQVIKKWTYSMFDSKMKFDCGINPEVMCAQLRFVCILVDSIGGVKGCSKIFGGFSAEVKASFVFFFVQSLCGATKNQDNATVLFILKVLRTLLLPSDILNLLNSQDEEQELLSQLLRLHVSTSPVCEIPDSGSQAQTELELFVADFIISRALVITGLARQIPSHSVLSAISLVRTFLYQLDVAPHTPLCRYWRTQLTQDVLDLIIHENYHVRRMAISCLPSLDVLSCITGLSTIGIYDTKNHIISSTLGYLFATPTRCSRETMMSWFIDACRFGSVRVHLISTETPVSPHEWNNYATNLEGNVKESIPADDKRKELQERILSLCFGPRGWSKRIQVATARSEILRVLLLKIFGSPRDPMLLRMLREFVACGWVDHNVFGVVVKLISAQMMNVPRLSEEFLDDNSASAAKTIEGLLFCRLAPLLVLRMLPRHVFEGNRLKLLCEREDLDHLNEYIDLEPAFNTEAVSLDTTLEILFHILVRCVVDPLEFKEVKMLAAECLAKFPPPLVLPLVLAYLVAFLREATPQDKRDSSLIVDEVSVPYSCGLVTAKLMVYYLNRVFSEDEYAYKDCDVTSRTLALLVQILGIPSVQGSDESLLTDLQRGCIDCIALLVSRLAVNDSEQEIVKVKTASTTSLMNLLMTWIFGNKNGGGSIEDCHADGINSRVQELLESMWSEVRYDRLPLQVRICCCNVLLSAISRSESSTLASWKSQGFISRIALATESSSEENVVAGGLQIIFSFLYKASESLCVEDKDDLQIVHTCFRTTVSRLETARSEFVAMNGLKVLGALIGKLSAFVGTLSPEDLQRLIDRCLITVRDRQISPGVSELAQSLLQAMTPP